MAQLAPGCRVSTASYIASMLRPEVIRDLKLGSYGLKMVACEPGVQAAFEDGDVVAWWNDRERMRASSSASRPADVEHFFDTERTLQRLASFLEPFFMEPPPDVRASGWRRAREMLRLAGACARPRARISKGSPRFSPARSARFSTGASLPRS